MEYKVIRIKRSSETKFREVMPKKDKIQTESYVEAEPLSDYYSRVENRLNEMAKDGWIVVNISYSQPIVGKFNVYGGWSETDSNNTEFIVVLSRDTK